MISERIWESRQSTRPGGLSSFLMFGWSVFGYRWPVGVARYRKTALLICDCLADEGTGMEGDRNRAANIMTTLPSHRPEIDGLRAVAVIGVLIYHANFPFLTGGFVGVDVFFVLSGFLVAKMLTKRDRRGNVDILTFFDRRIRRIFPAVVPCLIFSWLGAYFLLNSTQFVDFSKSAAASALFLANLYFWSTTGYFDGAAELKPLLHMWSLGVEIQFYVVYAAVTWAFVRIKISPLLPSLIILGASLLAATATVASGVVESAFYLPHLRFWEMLAGSVLALISSRTIPRDTANWMEVLGLALILAPMVLYGEGSPSFPGISAAPPVIGTLLVIAANNRGQWVAPLLRHGAVQFVGKISYSLYLWHLPLIVFARFIWPQPRTELMVASLVLSAILAYASYRFVEEPFRQGRLDTRRKLAAGYASSAASICILAFISLTSFAASAQTAAHTFLKTLLFNEKTVIAMSAINAAQLDYQANLNVNFWGTSGPFSSVSHGKATCSYDLKNSIDRVLECLTKQASERNSVLVIGDSHGRDTLHALRLAYPATNFVMLHQSSCPPAEFQLNKKVRCFRDLQKVLDALFAATPIDGVVLAFRYRPKEWRNVTSSLDLLAKYHVPLLMVGPRPVYKLRLDDWLARLPPFHAPPLEVAVDQNEMVPWDVLEIDAAARQLAGTSGFSYISIIDRFCQGGTCQLFNGTHASPLIWDQSHLTREGISLLAEYLKTMNLSFAIQVPPLREEHASRN